MDIALNSFKSQTTGGEIYQDPKAKCNYRTVCAQKQMFIPSYLCTRKLIFS